jgi:hypothetical protein
MAKKAPENMETVKKKAVEKKKGFPDFTPKNDKKKTGGKKK